MSVFEKYKTDPEAEKGKGIRIVYAGGAAIHMHRAGGANRKFQTRLEALLKPHQRKLKDMDPETANELQRKLFAETVVFGWDQVVLDDQGQTTEKVKPGVIDWIDGQELPYTAENAVMVWKELPDWFQEIVADANDRHNFQKEQFESNLGNS